MSLHYGYVAFLFFFAFLIFLDFSVSNKVKGGSISYRVSAIITAACFTIAMIFALGIYLFSSKEDSLLFITGYLIEFSLSIDNIFIFILIFQKFNINDKAQRRVLTIGILSAIVLRFFAISFGIGILEKMSWLFYAFGLILIYGGISIIKDRGTSDKKELGKFTDSLIRKFFRITDSESDKFIVRKKGKLYFTNLFIALILIEKSDIIFAADSIPVILSITNDVFIVFTSNMFAILGMRSMYFLVSNFSKKFIYIRYGLAVILIYMGIKMIFARLGFVFFPLLSIAVIAFSFIIPICISLKNGCSVKKDVSN
ncbi:TerC family protein [Candidatus Cyrtobacter comes]|uniref:TerC family protein n=1 Tax=Candidatus Cyrtobacter comes TaxID=675776 RepID=A0ABU5L840_9RICK|nr:TerC/Alx family metal homeostasis membrane protein [Candidatus Cyrtobacter comes]MDZ5762293.1 TerC family protein [Candidatus Cyrtobacter comes]